jgi:hypothetical protein
VLLSIAAYRQLTGEGSSILDLIAAPAGSAPFDLPPQTGLAGKSGR